MRPTIAALLLICAATPGTGLAQVGGNINYGNPGDGGGHARAVERERAIRQVGRDEAPPGDSALYLTAGVLMNVRADEFVATFGVAEEGETVAEAQGRMDRTVAAFAEALRPLGIGPGATFVDFAAQVRLYRFDVEGDHARERPAGFEIKKTVAVRYRDKLLIDRLVAAAAEARIYDLVRVDYVVTDLDSIHERLAEEASRVIRAKVARHERLLGIRLRPAPQVVADRSATYAPADLYDSYTPGEAEAVVGGFDRSRLVVQSLRRGRTFFYHPLDADGYDHVVDPVIVEPVVQFTTFLKLRYEIETRR